MRIVVPCSFASATILAKRAREAASIPAMGSSMMSNSGRRTRARAMRTRWAWPPDRMFMGEGARWAIPTRSSASIAREVSPGIAHRRRGPSRPERTTSIALALIAPPEEMRWGT